MKNSSWEAARQTACDAAAEAWRQVAALYESGSHVTQKADGPSTEADRLADRLIAESLQRSYPADRFGYLTEESEDDNRRLDRKNVWIIDPIDGTNDFIKKNGNFTVHIGYVEQMESGLWEVVAASVYRPVLGLMFSAVRGGGSQSQRYKDHAPAGKPEPMQVSRRSPVSQMKAVISNSHRDNLLDRLMQSLHCADVLSIGSIGLKLSLIATAECDFYVNLARGKCKEWDACAPDLILSEAGGVMTDLSGRRLTYNQKHVILEDGLLASNGPAHAELVNKVADFEREEARAR